MTTAIPLSPDDVVRAFPPETFHRGLLYAEQSWVLTADYNAQTLTATGRVRGTASRVYQCIVRLIPKDKGYRVIGQCSCPEGHNCKHAVALLVRLAGAPPRPAALPQRPVGYATPAPPPPPPPPPTPTAAPAPASLLPSEVIGWLARGEQLARALSPDPYCLLYVLRLETPLIRLLARAYKVRRRAGGGYGAPADFNIHGRSEARFLTLADQRILALTGNTGAFRSEAELGVATGHDMLRTIAETGRGFWEGLDGSPLSWCPPREGRLVWRLTEDAHQIIVIESDRPGLIPLPLAPPCWLDPATGECGPLITGLGDREAALLAAAPRLPAIAASQVRTLATAKLGALHLPLPEPPKRRHAAAVTPTPCLHLTSTMPAWEHTPWGMARGEWVHRAHLHFDYDGTRVEPLAPGQSILRVEGDGLVEIPRDPATEVAARRHFEQLGFMRQDGPASYGLPGDDTAWLSFMARDEPRLRAAGWRISHAEGFQFRMVRAGAWTVEIDEGPASDWLELGLGVEVDEKRMDLLPLLLDIVRRFGGPEAMATWAEDGALPVHLEDGRILLLPVKRVRPILSTLVELYDHKPLDSGGRLRLGRAQGGQLAELEEQLPGVGWSGGEEARAWGRRLRDFTGITPAPPPAGFAAALRPYQQQGLDWLQFLREYGLGGVLADDMGLGKTVQTLAHLMLEKVSGRADRPSLVVAPTSLMFNWRREAERFAPGLRVLVLQGPQRLARFRQLPDCDLALTTYPLLPRDFERLAEQPYHLLILDEAQAVKNLKSRAAQAVRGLQARHRLALTGTPMENHLGELWAIMDFLMPSLLGDEQRFRRVFRNPIEREGDSLRQEQLRRRVAPFLLRRTKGAVAAELPPKTEILREVALEGDQRDLYETLRLALHTKVREEVAQRGLARSGIIILDALLKLRQVCCDPRLVALESARKVKGSAKLALLMTLLPEMLEEGRRILLFSQFTSMLTLIEEELGKRSMREGEGYVKLTGRTRDRDAPVDRFQSGEVPLFLISLKAGGSGLNLTAADTVIHYDPWWNPAAERQATDRAHRLGQDKPVFVYKLLTEGTVEQKVAALQARKQALADAMLEGGGAAAGALSVEDLDLLFAPLE